MKNPALTFLIFVSFGYATASLADQELEFDVDSVRTISGKLEADRKEDKTEKKTESYPMRVMLGKDYISVDSQGRKKIYDFQKRRIFTVDIQNGVYSDRSLYEAIGFLSIEYRNREALRNVLSKGGLDKVVPGFEPVFVEHEFGLSDKKIEPKIEEGRDSQSIWFESQGKPLLSYDKKLHKLNDIESVAYIRFLRYRFGGHPVLLDKLKALKGIPRSIKFTRYSHYSEAVIVLKSAKSTKTIGYTLDGMKKGVLSEDKSAFSAFLFKQEGAISDAVLREENISAQMQQACKEGRYMDCVLGYSEWSLQTGRDIPQQKSFLDAYREQINANPEHGELVLAMNPRSKEGFEKAVATLARLRKHSVDKQHVLKIFEANQWIALRNPQKAIALFHEALLDNPFITGVYRDLGDAYYAGFQTGLAWQAWDFGRKLYPHHGIFARVNELEKKLVATYPEFF